MAQQITYSNKTSPNPLPNVPDNWVSDNANEVKAVVNNNASETDANTSGITSLGNSKLDSVVGGTNVTVDNTDPLNPVINASGGSTPTQIALYSATTTGTVTLDCATFDSWYRILTGNTDFQFSNTPPTGETFVKNLQVITTAGESLTFTTANQVIGTFVNDDTTLNLITISFANYPTVGLYISVVISS